MRRRFRCRFCGHEYDPARGDPRAGVKPGTPFERLPPGWRCPVCGAPREAFTAAGRAG